MDQPGESPSDRMIPKNTLDCPPGLEYLATIDQVLVYQKNEIPNKYEIKNISGETVYHAVEEESCCQACFCYDNDRSFDMKILDNHENEVIHLYRPRTWHLDRMKVFTPPGSFVGTIQKKFGMLPEFSIKNASGETIFRIKRPFLSETNFRIMSADALVQVGVIKKKRSALLQELFTDADNFGITFPTDLDVRVKAILLGACFLIDMMYFEV